MNSDIAWMQRALQLAEYGRGNVSPNPMVGCVVVHAERIIGEGWHRRYGEPHAEVRAIEDVENKGCGSLLAESTVYVTLEPCAHTGKTPPCAELLVRKKIKRVVICNGDPNPLVSGKGVERLLDAGIQVDCGILAHHGLVLNKRFFTSLSQNRPYIILKWAETADGFIGKPGGRPVPISSEASNRRVHAWRSEEDAILVGFRTALADNPRLDVRLWNGPNPVRVVLDRNLSLPESHNLFDRSQPTIVVNYLNVTEMPNTPERYSDQKSLAYILLKEGEGELAELLLQLQQRKIQSVLVEGGTAVITSFLSHGLWDEIRRCQSPVLLGNGIKAPVFQGIMTGSEQIREDLWTYYSKA